MTLSKTKYVEINAIAFLLMISIFAAINYTIKRTQVGDIIVLTLLLLFICLLFVTSLWRTKDTGISQWWMILLLFTPINLGYVARIDANPSCISARSSSLAATR